MFVLPSHPQMRHWKVRLKNGVWRNVKKTIKNQAELSKALRGLGRWEDMDIYYSTSCFLDPENVRGKSDRDIILYSDFVLDIDDANLELARQKAVKVYKLMANAGHECQKIVFSGSKGYHLYYDLAGSSLGEIHPVSRFKSLNTLYLLILSQLNLQQLVDWEITVDPYRVIRLPGSINQKSGRTCRVIDYIELQRPAIAPSSDSAGKQKAKGAHEDHPPRQPIGRGEQSGLSSQPPFISNKVSGTRDRYTLVLKWPNTRSYQNIVKKVARLIDEYNLPDLYAFKSSDSYYIISTAVFQPRQLSKILAKAKSEITTIKAHFPLDCMFLETIHGRPESELWLSKSHFMLYSVLTRSFKEQGKRLCGDLKMKVMIPDGKR